MTPAKRNAAQGARLLVTFGGSRKSSKAHVRAAGLDGDLLTIDVAQVVSTWIGETEKNLTAVFEAAERSGAVLLFDEADSLFGRRSEVSDSHDRYADLEISDLLKRLEQYPGIPALVLRTAGPPLHLPTTVRAFDLDNRDDERPVVAAERGAFGCVELRSVGPAVGFGELGGPAERRHDPQDDLVDVDAVTGAEADQGSSSMEQQGADLGKRGGACRA